MKKDTSFRVVVGVLAFLSVAGVAAWIFQLMQGLEVTGMNNGVSWGLYITTFMFFVGLSAGGLIVASSASVFGVKKYKRVAKPAVLLSTICIIAAAVLVVIDLGNAGRIFNLLLHPNFSSPLMWDVVVISSYLIINLLYLWFMTRKNPDDAKIAVVSRFALPVAILVHSVTAWIFGLQIAKVGWFSAVMAPLFVASALDSGLALLLIVLVMLNATGAFKTGKELIGSLAGLLATCIAIDGFLVFCELLTMGYPGGHEAEYLALLMTGPTAPFFWGELILGIAVPFLILVFRKCREKTALVVLASTLVVLGVFFKRVWLLCTAFVALNVPGAPGVMSGNNMLGDPGWSLMGAYVPTAVEVVIVVGVIALSALAYILLAHKVFGEQPAMQEA